MNNNFIIYVVCMKKVFSCLRSTQRKEYPPAIPNTTQKSGVFPFGILTGLPLKMLFEGGNHHRSETHIVLISRKSAKSTVKMQKTKICNQNPASRCGIFVTEYALFKRAQFRSTHSYKTMNICKSI